MILENFQLLLLQDAVGSIRQKRPLDLVKAEKNREMDPIMVDPVSYEKVLFVGNAIFQLNLQC
jgi:hypothetical protein